jgi:hypothetical protein
MNPVFSRNGKRWVNQHGGISVGTVLLSAVVLLLIAVLGLGYAWMQTYSENASLRNATNAIRLTNIHTALVETNNANAAAEAARKERMAVAKARRDDFIVRAKGVTNQIHNVLDRIKPLQTELENLSTGPVGQLVAPHPDLVMTARGLFTKEVQKLPKDFDVTQRLESVRRLMLHVAQSDNTEYVPSDEINTTVEDIRKWADIASKYQEDVTASVQYLKNEAEIKILPEGASTKQTLKAAMAAQAALVTAKATTKTIATIDEATTDGAAKTAEAKAKEIREQAERNAAEIQRRIEDQRRAEREAELVREAGSAEVRQILAVIATPGIMEANGRSKPSGKPGPMSYNALVSAGCTLPGTAGMKNLYGVASHPDDRERPRWERKYGGVFMNYPDRREVVSKAHDTLIRLGPYLVKAGVLEP